MRNAECIEYFFYKNFVFTLVQFLYGFYCNFTGQTIIDDWFITTFNLIFTSFPLACRALLDHDLKPDDGEIVNKMLPFMYKENRDNPIFTITNFILNMIKGIIHCMINFFIVIYVFKDECFDENGNLGELWVISVCLFTNMLLIVSGDLLVYTKYHTWINFVLMGVTTFVLYIGFVFLVHNVSYFNSVGTMFNTFRSAKIWFLFIFIVGTCILIDFTILAFKFTFNKNISNTLKIIYNSKGDIDNEEDVPDEIKEKLKIYKTNETETDDNKDENKKLEEESKNELLKEKNKKIFDEESENSDSKKISNSEKSSKNLDKKKSKFKNNSESESSNKEEKDNKNNKLKSKNKNKKIKEKSFSNNSIDSNSQLIGKNNNKNLSESKSSRNSSNKKSYSKNSNSKSSVSQSSNTNSDYIESNEEDDIPKKTMEFMNKNNNNKNMNETDDFDDIGENYEEEFSERMNKEVKYFNPKQSNVPNFKHYENKIPREKFK